MKNRISEETTHKVKAKEEREREEKIHHRLSYDVALHLLLNPRFSSVANPSIHFNKVKPSKHAELISTTIHSIINLTKLLYLCCNT